MFLFGSHITVTCIEYKIQLNGLCRRPTENALFDKHVLKAIKLTTDHFSGPFRLIISSKLYNLA